MNLTPEELDTFRNLSETELGQFLRGYMKKVQDYCFDSRNWSAGMTHEAAKMAANLLQTCVVDKIRPVQEVRQERNPHE